MQLDTKSYLEGVYTIFVLSLSEVGQKMDVVLQVLQQQACRNIKKPPNW